MSQELIDFSILPSSRIQNYESKIEQQHSTIQDLSKKVTHLESLLDKTDEREKEKGSISEASIPSAEEDTNKIDIDSRGVEESQQEQLPEVTIKQASLVDPEESSEPKITKGKNINRECLA